MKDEHELREEEEEQEPVVVRDKRRVDPETGAVRESAAGPAPAAPPVPEEAGEPMSGQVVNADPAAGAPAGEESPGDQVSSLQAQLADTVADLQRVQAEYANYRKRVERDRAAVREQALANVLGDLLPVLDDIGRAREHGELQGGFRQVAESLEQIATKLGLVRFGEAGEPFDPTVHEALMHSYSSDVTETTCVSILQPGYAVNERVLRPARVAVAEPEPAQPETERETAEPEIRPGEQAGVETGSAEHPPNEAEH